MMQTAEHWNECWHCNPKKFAQAYSPQDCPCKCHVSPTPDSMTGDTEFRKDVEKVWDTNGSPNPTDSLVDTFEEITSWRPHDDLVRKQYGEVIRDVKSFISEVRQKAVDEAYKLGVEHGRNGTIITQD